MSKKQIIWSIVFAIFVLPSLLYFTVNGYWWLFDGNQPDPNKMVVTLNISIFGTFIMSILAIVGEVWHND